MVGQLIGKYRVTDRVGKGGMGTVYRATDEMLHREVAIKVLNAELNDPEVAKRFRAEAITVARLSHPGIATIYELFEHDGQWLMVMEFVRGETLEHMAQRMGPLSPQRASELCMQALAALAHAHSMGVVHRDLKPANLMIAESGSVKVMDFGIARVTGSEHLTNAGFMMGTPAYMAPEQVRGGEVDARADLYAMGVVFYRLVGGRLPFKGDTAFAMVQSQVNDAPTPLRTVREELPVWADEIIARALAKPLEQRFQSAAEFHEALARCLAGIPLASMYAPADQVTMITPPRLPSGAFQSRPMPVPSASFPVPIVPTLTPTPAVSTGSAPAAAPGGTGSMGAAGGSGSAALPGAAGASGVSGPGVAPGAAGAAAPAGTAVPGGAVPGTAAAPGVPAAAHAPAQHAPGARKKSPPLALIGVAVLVVGGIVAALVMTRGGGSPAIDQAPTPTPIASAEPTPTPDPAVIDPAAAAVDPAAAAAAAAAGAAGTTGAGAAAAGAGTAALTPTPTGTPGARGAATVARGTPTPTPTAAAAGSGATVGAGAAGAGSAGSSGSGAGAAAGATGGGDAAGTASFGNVKAFVVTGNRAQDRDAVLNFGARDFSIVPRAGGTPIATVAYNRITSGTYVRGRDPKWAGTLASPPPDVNFSSGLGGVFGGRRHWLVLQGPDHYEVLRLEDENVDEILKTIEARTGLKIQRP